MAKSDRKKSLLHSRIGDIKYKEIAAIKTIMSPEIDLSAVSATETVLFIADRNYIVISIVAKYVVEASSSDTGVASSVGHDVDDTPDIDEFCLYTSEISIAEGTEKDMTLLKNALNKGDILICSGPATQKTGTGVIRYIIQLLPKMDNLD